MAPRSELLSRTARAALALACIAGLSACAPEHESELLEVRRVAPDRVEPGQILRIRGAGFPPGRAGRARLEGRMHAPGASPRNVALELDARAVSSDEVEVPFTEAALARLGGRGTLHGRVTVLFAASGGAVVGRSPALVLDVIEARTERLGEELARRRRGAGLARRLGVVLAEEAAGETGLKVEDVAPESVAARLGLALGDRLVTLEGVRLHALSDFVPPPGRREARIETVRESEGAPFVVLAPMGERRQGLTQGELVVARIALGWVLFVLLFLAPSARVLETWTLGPPEGERRSAFLRGSIAAALLAVVMGIDRGGLLGVPLEALVSLALLARASAAYTGARRSGARTLAALGASAGAVGTGLVVALALGCLAAIGGTTDLSALHELQGAAPWEWTAFRTPAGPLVVGLVLVAGSWSARERSHPFASFVGDAVTLMLSAAVAALLLGGWVGAPSGWGSALAGIGFVAKTLVCWSAMRRAGAIPWTARTILATGITLLAAIAITAGWIVWEPGLEVERALAEVLTAALATAIVWLVTRRVAGLAKTDPLAPPHPFL